MNGDPYRYQRERLVEELAHKGIADPRVLDALRTVPRHLFVPESRRSQSYQDHALPIGEKQTISQPWVVARMTEHLAPEPEDSVLEIGTGSGYQTAILAQMVRVVYSIERLAPLAQTAITRMRELGLNNVKVHVFDGTVGWSDWAPYDRILVTAGAPATPQRLLDQLANKGRMVVPEGDLERQRLVLYTKDARGRVTREALEAVAFVPLIGREGWSES